MLLEADAGGRGDAARVFVLLHGMGTTREVWRPLIALLEREWNGSWIAPDLRGHGRSPRAASYALSEHATDVADTIHRLAPDASRVAVLGHSMGGVIGLALASGAHGLQPTHALGLGIKIKWSAEEIAKLRGRARAPAKSFQTRDVAVSFYLKVSGLAGLVAADDPIAQAGVAGDGLALAASPATAEIGPPDMAALIAASRAPAHLAAGEGDAMTTLADMRLYDPNAILISGVGHNAMIEAPERVFAWAAQAID